MTDMSTKSDVQSQSSSCEHVMSSNVNDCDSFDSANFQAFCGPDAPRCYLGIDEAGRGPVLGPMVYSIGIMPLHAEESLKSLGVNDSKQLNEDKRNELFQAFNAPDYSLFAYRVRVIAPLHLSRVMQRRVKYSLNDESHDSAIGLIQYCVDKGVNIDGVFVDTVGTPETYQAKLQSRFPSLNITVAKKADSLFVVVGAGSICAKVTRDHRVSEWKFPEHEHDPQLSFMPADKSWGSGYPGDPQTKAFLVTACDRVFGFPSFVRFDWSTATNIMDKRCCAVTWPDDEDEAVAATKSLFNYFGAKRPAAADAEDEDSENQPPAKCQRRHAFFMDRRLTSVDSF